MDQFLWVVFPYLCLATFVVGHFWRYRYDKFGWTTRSSQLYEDRMLRIALTEAGSRWAGAVQAVTATLPPLRGDEWDAVRRLAAEGPPEEEVGLAPFAHPQFSPGAAGGAATGTTLLPMPSFPGVRA